MPLPVLWVNRDHPPAYTQIGYRTFDGCSGLTEITLPPGLTKVAQYAFTFCSELAQITLPPRLVFVGLHTFLGCPNIASLVTPDPTFRGIPRWTQPRCLTRSGRSPWRCLGSRGRRRGRRSGYSWATAKAS